MKRAALTTLTVFAVCCLPGCGGAGTTEPDLGTTSSPSGTASSSTQPTTTASATHLTIVDGAYDSDLEVEPGATITVHNADTVSHNVVAEDGSFRTPTIPLDEEATFTAPTEAGEYPFVCTLHPGMRATVKVALLASGDPAPETSSPDDRTPDTPRPRTSSSGTPPPDDRTPGTPRPPTSGAPRPPTSAPGTPSGGY